MLNCTLRERWAVGLIVLAGMLGVCTPGHAQSVLNFQNAWTNTNNPLPVGNYATRVISGNAGSSAAIIAPGSGNAEVTLALLGQAIDNLDATVDSFNLVIQSTQQFQTNAASLVTIPTHINGNFTFPAGASGISSLNYNVTVLNNLNVATGLDVNQTINRTAAQGNLAVNAYNGPSMNLAAGTYNIRATLTLTGTGDPAPAGDGSQVLTDFFTNGPDGLITSFSAVPGGLGDSRSFINAPAARTKFGVDGSGVLVGIVEPGHAYTTHTSLAGRVVTVIGPAGVPAGATSLDSEHTLAVAGIIGSADANVAQAGVAPGVNIQSAAYTSYNGATSSARFRNATTALINAGATVINMSASTDISNPGADASSDGAWIDGQVNANPNLVFVKSSGNAEPLAGNSITAPGQAFNILTVGALNQNFTQRAAFSSYSHDGEPIKPDIVAPGEYILAPNSINTNGDGQVNDFSRGFLGEDYHRAGATTSDVTGTSFAAPHVAGVIALMQEYQMDNNGTHDADHRVLKAVLLNEANRTVTHNGGGAWAQAKTGSSSGQNLIVTRSLDTELGAGAADAMAALDLYSRTEARAADNNAQAHFNLTPVEEDRWWDLETVAANGTVNYLLSDDIDAHSMRATLTWDHNGAILPELELRLFHEGSDDFNVVGYDMANPDEDVLIAQTMNAGENVKLLEFYLPEYGPSENPGFYLQVLNNSATSTMYGLAFLAPEPGSLILLIACASAALCRRRAA